MASITIDITISGPLEMARFKHKLKRHGLRSSVVAKDAGNGWPEVRVSGRKDILFMFLKAGGWDDEAEALEKDI